MDADEFLEDVRGEQQTELSRLGSSKSLYADTEGEMEEEAVLAAVADLLGHAAETFEGWAADEDGAGEDLFTDAAATVGRLADTVAEEHGDYEAGEVPAVVAHLDSLDSTVERVAGYVGWALVADEKVGQAVGFFVGQASPMTANTFRDLRDDVAAAVDEGAAALVAVCEDGGDEDLAREAAVGTVQAAYDDYFETLEDLGVNPKPVC